MKKIRIEDGKLFAYIHAQDVLTLVSIKDFVKESIFQEESILKGDCDEEGYYKIEDLSNVHYIRGLSFIPNYDYLLKLSLTELETLQKEGLANYNVLSTIAYRVCNSEDAISDNDVDFIGSLSELKVPNIDSIKGTTKSIELRKAYFCICCQFQHYINSLDNMIELKRKKQVASYEKQFSLRKVFTSLKKQGD